MAFYRCGTSGGSGTEIAGLVLYNVTSAAIVIPDGAKKISYNSITIVTGTLSSATQLRIYKNYGGSGQNLLTYATLSASGGTVDFSSYNDASHVYFNVASGSNMTINEISFSS